MSFVVIIPARLASTRLPGKPLADLGGKPMVVRVAEQAMKSGANQVVVATDHLDIVAACAKHGIAAHLTREDHPSGTDRIAEVAASMGLPDDAIVVNVQGDEPLIDPALIAATAALVSRDTPMATAAHPISLMPEVFDPNVVKVALNKEGHAIYFSRAPIPWSRDGFAQSKEVLPAGYKPLRHVGLYAYLNSFLQAYPEMEISPLEQIEALEQLRILWHGHRIAVYVTHSTPAAGVDTPHDLARVQRHFEMTPAM